MATSNAPQTEESVPVVSANQESGIQMPDLPADWKFNNLLIQIGKKMIAEDLDAAKTMFKGRDGLGRRLLSEIRTASELFDALQTNLFLNRNNMLYLQAMLYHIGREDLYDMAIDYAQSAEGNVVHFSKPPAEPANGYRYIQFHIQGKDFTQEPRESVEDIRMKAAKLMFVPTQYVIIAGIEPSSSLLITIMVPERFVKYFKAALEKTSAVEELKHLGIDYVQIAGRDFYLHGLNTDATVAQPRHETYYDKLQTAIERLEDRDIECLQLKRKLKEKENKLNNIDKEVQTVKQPKHESDYDKLQTAIQRLEDREIECLQLKRKLEEKENQLNNIDKEGQTVEQPRNETDNDKLQTAIQRLEDRDIECLQLKRKLEEKENQLNNIDKEMKAMLVKILFESGMNKTIPKLSKQSALVFFKHALSLVRQKNYDRDVIDLLLDAQSFVLSARVRDAQENQIKLLRFENQRLRDVLFELQIVNTRLQLLSAIDIQEFLREFLKTGKIVTKKSVQFDRAIFQIMKVISELLRPEDRKALLDAYSWQEQDLLTHLQRNQNDLLAVLVAKETFQTNQAIDLEKFILGKLSEIKREDLKNLFSQLISTYNSERHYTQRTAGQPSQEQVWPGKQASNSSESNSDKQQPTTEDQISEVLQRLKNIEEMIQKSQATPKASTLGADFLQSNLFRHMQHVL